MRDKIKYLLMLILMLFCIIKVDAVTLAEFNIVGPTNIKQGQTVTYSLIVNDEKCASEADKCTIDVTDDSFFSGEATEDNIFEFVSFSSESGATYDKQEDVLFFEDEEGNPLTAKNGDVIATITFKVKDDAKVGEVTWTTDSYFAAPLTVSKKEVIPETPSDEPEEPTNESETSILDNEIFIVGSVIGVYVIALVLLIYFFAKKK